MITPKYPSLGINNHTNTILPKNSITLEIRGTIFLPNPCNAFRRFTKIPSGAKNNTFHIRYLEPLYKITSLVEPETKLIKNLSKKKIIIVARIIQTTEIICPILIPSLIRSILLAPLF